MPLKLYKELCRSFLGLVPWFSDRYEVKYSDRHTEGIISKYKRSFNPSTLKN